MLPTKAVDEVHCGDLKRCCTSTSRFVFLADAGALCTMALCPNAVNSSDVRRILDIFDGAAPVPAYVSTVPAVMRCAVMCCVCRSGGPAAMNEYEFFVAFEEPREARTHVRWQRLNIAALLMQCVCVWSSLRRHCGQCLSAPRGAYARVQSLSRSCSASASQQRLTCCGVRECDS